MTPALLAEVIDAEPQALRAVLQRGLPGFADAGLVIEALRVVKLRRSSSRQRHPHPLTLCVDLDVHAPARSLRGVQRLYGKAYRQGASAEAHARARAGLLAPVAFGAALAHLPALDMVWWAWPNDPGLPQLPTLMDPLQLTPCLPAALLQPGETVAEVQALRYEPEVRATLQATLRSPQGTRTVYGKTFDDERGQVVHQRFVAAWQRAAADPLAALVPEPLGYDAPTRTLWQAAAPGVPLASLDEGRRIEALRCLGQALGRLHDTPLAQGSERSLAPSSERSLGHWLLEAERRATKIGRAAPALAPRVQALVQALQAAAARLPATPLSLVHGDFHPEQVWVHEGRPLLFDFDEFALGQPMEDLASFITRLQQGPGAKLAAACKTALLQGYRQAAPARWQPAGLQWHLVMQALLQTSRAFVFQVPGWPAELARRLTVAEARAHEMQEHLA